MQARNVGGRRQLRLRLLRRFEAVERGAQARVGICAFVLSKQVQTEYLGVEISGASCACSGGWRWWGVAAGVSASGVLAGGTRQGVGDRVIAGARKQVSEFVLLY